MSMTVTSAAMKAYQNATKIKQELDSQIKNRMKPQAGQDDGFTNMFKDSLAQVNHLEDQKSSMIKEFASGKTENVHELMITLQKAGLAMTMTSAVRNKVMSAYQEMMRMSF